MEDVKCLVSIIVPVFNAAGFIRETIDSVIRQSLSEWELIFVDDCSADDSCDIIKSIMSEEPRIRLISREQNRGAAWARNEGVRNAKGRYICFLDADDIWDKDKLLLELEFIREKKAGFVFTGYEFADENGCGSGKVVHVPQTITYGQALKNTTIFTSTVMIDTGIIQKDDIYMPDVESEDTATWWHLLKRYGAAYGLDCNLVKYRRSAGTLSSNKARAIRRIWNLYRNIEGLSLLKSAYCMCFWALRAVIRRI